MARSKIAEELRRDDERWALALAPGERVRLALELGERDLAFFMATNRLERDDALKQLARANQVGRRHSKCIEELLK